MTIAALLLAAGRSIRFGASDKISAPLNGSPLGLHAAKTLRALPLAMRFVVTNTTDIDWSGWGVVPNDRPEAGIGYSIALGTVAARRAGATALLVALADMPFVSVGHFESLLACNHGPDSIAASSNGQHRMPPAFFGFRWFDALERLSGEQGARALLSTASTVEAPPAQLLDIDDEGGLAAIQGMSGSGMP